MGVKNIMTSNIDEIGKKALKLSARDRALLIRKLIHSLEDEIEGDDNVEELWIKEAKYRYDQFKQGKTSEKSANQVFQDAKANLK